MPYTLVIKEEARLDMLEAYQYYEQQQTGLGEQFLSEVEKRLDDITSHPEYYSFIDNRKILRDIVLDKFPYVVIYDVIGFEITVFAVHFTKRNPAKTNIPRIE
ncbi:MAG: type II toxin-antitoxin system RelE/ParE family toxin [Taibaiella sp.]|jgi:mRNA-degrading endonuclease RelE of RelBE toxin-antitoxin system